MKIKWIKISLKIAIFSVGLLIGIELLVAVLYPLNTIVANWRHFYTLPTQSIDILIVGSSHAYCSFNQTEISEKTGNSTYILASNSQNVVQSYFNVKEVLKYQKPKAIILEAFSLDSNDNWQWDENKKNDDKDWKKESNIDGMRFGLTKLEAIKEQYYPHNWAYAFFRIARCHGNWKDMEQIDKNYAFLNDGILTFSPFRPSQSVMSQETIQQYAKSQYKPNKIQVSEANISYFHKLAQLCRIEGIELYVIMAPMYDVYIDSINYNSWTEKILELAENEQIPYLECNLYYDEIGLTAQDFEDNYSAYHHLNTTGAEKVTQFILEEFDEVANN